MPAPRWRIAPPDPRSADLAASLGVTPVTAQILCRRGLDDPARARAFLEAPLERLSDPGTIVDLPAAAERLARAAAAGEAVTVYGDYDADGVTATAILVRGLRALGAAVDWFVPSRFLDGYGLTASALARLRERGARLIVAVDCGVTAVEEIAQAQAAGLEIIVVDHHEPAAALPPAVAVIDPKRRDAGAQAAGGFRDYAAAGLAFQLLRAVARRAGGEETPGGLLDLAALGTIADVVPLVEDNRIIARAGLERMRTAPAAGVAALLRAAGLAGEVTARHVGFSLAPRINAAGRLGDAGLAVRLLLTDDPVEAEGIAATLDAENRARQQLCEQILAQAVERVEGEALHQAPAIVLAGEGWHPGVIGIVASQLVERYHRPVVLLAVAEGIGRGSARSIEAFHLVDGLRPCEDLLERYGGHAMAAGLTVAADRIPAFARRFEEVAAARLRPEDLVPVLPVDAEVALSTVTEELARELGRLAPFGPGNPEPVLAVRGVQAVTTRVMGDGVHLRMGVTDGAAYAEAVGFRFGDASELLAFTRARLDLAFTVALDRWEGRERVELVVRDLQTPGLDLEAVLTDSRLLVDRLFARAQDYLEDGAFGIEEAGAFHTKVVGVTFEGRQEVVRALVPGQPLRLQREPGNPVDPHAIRVLTGDGRQVGYLSARIAARLAPSMDAGARYTAAVTQITGGPGADGDRAFGVNIAVQLAPSEPEVGDGLARAWAGLPAAELIDRLRIHLRRGLAFTEPQREVLRAVLEGRPALAVFGPGRGRGSLIAAAAAAHAAGGGAGPVVVAAPLRGQVERLADDLRARLAPLGLRVLAAHGALVFRRRQRVLEALARRTADVVVASLEYLRAAPATLRPSLVLLECDPAVDAAAVAEALERVGQPCWCAFASSLEVEGLAGLRALRRLEVAGDLEVRTTLRLVDRRGARERTEILADAVGRTERTLVRVGSRREAVEVARALRERDLPVAYSHGGLPLRVREVLVQALADGRLRALVAADGVPGDAVPGALRQVIIAGLPADRAEFVEWLGGTGAASGAATVVLLYGREDLAAAEAALAETHPGREALAHLFRAVRERAGRPGGASWPDEGLRRDLAPVLPSARAIGVGLDILAEIGVLQREFDGERWRLTVPEPVPRRDLARSLRYTEGSREMQEVAALAGAAFGPLPALLRLAAGGQQADRSETR